MNRPSFALPSTFATLLAWALVSAPAARAEDVDTSNHPDTMRLFLCILSLSFFQAIAWSAVPVEGEHNAAPPASLHVKWDRAGVRSRSLAPSGESARSFRGKDAREGPLQPSPHLWGDGAGAAGG